MDTVWLPLLSGVGALLLGAFLATAFWWWAAPRVLLMRWSAPLRDALDAGFSDQGLQYRLRAQADKLWARRQQALWRESLEQIHARHEACLLAEIRLLLRSAGPTAGGGGGGRGGGAPALRPAALVQRSASASPLSPGQVTAAASPETPLTDAQIDALPPELPDTPPGGRRRVQAGTSVPAFKPL